MISAVDAVLYIQYGGTQQTLLPSSLTLSVETAELLRTTKNLPDAVFIHTQTVYIYIYNYISIITYYKRRLSDNES